MSSEFSRTVTLGECATFQEGYVNPSQSKPEYFGSDYKWLRATDLNNGFVFETGRKLSKKGFESAGKSALLFEPETLAISKSGTIGRVGILKDYMCGNRAVINIKVNPNCDTRFIFYSLLQKRGDIELLAEGSVQKNLYCSSLAKLKIDLPVLGVQRQISSFIGALDDRISLLRETNATLEAIAQALFKSWFVDFDPVHANAHARAQNTNNHPQAVQQNPAPHAAEANAQNLGLDAATAALFPDHFQDSDLGPIPAGWRVSNIGESFILTMGQSPPGDTYNENGEGLPFYQGRTDFGFRFPKQRVFCTAPSRLAEAGDVLLSVRAPVGDVNLALEDCALGRGVAGLRHSKGFQSFTLYALKSLEQSFAMYNGEGTVFGSINKKDLSALPVIEAPDEIQLNFEKIVQPIDGAIENNEKKLRTLTQLRDTLLPRLISGQLRLPSVEAQIEAVVGGA